MCNVMHFVENCFFVGEDDRGEWTHVCADVCLSESCAHSGAGDGGDGQDAEVTKFC